MFRVLTYLFYKLNSVANIVKIKQNLTEELKIAL